MQAVDRVVLRRFTRLALHFVHYNFCRMHKTQRAAMVIEFLAERIGQLRMTPAMAAGIVDRVMDVADIVKMIDAIAPAPKRTSYKPRRKKLPNRRNRTKSV